MPTIADEWCEDNSGNSPYVCVDWSLPGAPDPDTNFRFDFQTDPDNPSVAFISGDLGWVVWSQVSDTNTAPAALGDITIDASVSTDDFSVTIAQSATVAGATSVGSLNLKDPTSWTGYSTIAGGTITGDLNGDLIAVRDTATSSGGTVALTIEGDMIGNIDVYDIGSAGLTIKGDFGDATTNHSMQFVNVSGGNVNIEGDAIRADIDITGELNAKSFNRLAHL